MVLDAGGTVVNQTGGYIGGGVQIAGARGAVVNAAYIRGAQGVVLNAGGGVTNQSGGKIIGGIQIAVRAAP